MQLKGKHIVITGGTGGIGQPLCNELLQAGAHLTVIGREPPSSQDVHYVQGNLSTPEGIQQVIGHIAAMQVDILINIAGMQYFGYCEAQPPEHTVALYTLNLIAPALLTQSVLGQMKARKSGHIVNIGSTFGSINFAHFATYSSSKAGLRGFSEALRREVKHDGIHVTYIAPRAVKTPLNNDKILEFGRMTKMNMDTPEWVAAEIVKAIMHRKKDVFLGFPEKLFVRINAVAPRLLDTALASGDAKAKSLFQPSLPESHT